MAAHEALAQARAALDAGDPLLACEACDRLIEAGPGEAAGRAARQLRALALARSGAPLAAAEALRALLADTPEDAESLGLLASASKELALQARELPLREVFLRQAASLYAQAHRLQPRAWFLVNLATLAYVMGDAPEARRHATQALEGIDAGASGEDALWAVLTAAECHLLLGEDARASERYAAARRGRSFGRLASARRNARIIAAARGRGEADLDAIFPPPSIVVFSGHRADAPDATRARFPASAEGPVAEAIGGRLEAWDAEIGIGSLADGADILFHERMLARGGDVHVVLPSSAEQFVQTSVAPAWRTRFDAVLARAASVVQVGRDPGDDADFLYASQVVTGTARLMARSHGARVRGLAVWDGSPGRAGGTGEAVRLWAEQGIEATAIDPRDGRVSRVRGDPASDVLGRGGRRLAYLLFCDAQGFSRLGERAVATFVSEVLAPLGDALRRHGDEVLCANTWGDAIYAAFRTPTPACRFALALAKACLPERMRALGLPEDVRFRVALHAGPVTAADDPVTQRPNCFGSHVTWAARMEPVTPGGAVYVSEAFAALAALEPGLHDVELAYVGRVPLAKGHGTSPMYAVVDRAPRG